MRERFSHLAGLRPVRLVALLLLAGAVACSQGRTRLRVNPDFLKNTPRCIAVAPFENLSLTSFGGVAVAELLASELERTLQFVVLEPGGYQYLSQNLNVAGTASADKASLNLLRQELGLDGVVVGSVSEYWYTDDPEVYRDKQPSVAFTARLIEVETGNELWSASYSRTPGSGASHIKMLSGIAGEVAADLAQELLAQFPDSGRYRLNSNPDQSVCMFEDLVVAGKVPGRADQPRSPQQQPQRQPPPASLEQEPVDLSDAALKLVDRLKRGEPFVLRGVTFEYAKNALRSESEAVLELIGEVLRAYPDLVVAVIAHTDNMGDPDELQTLSLNQAEAIREALTERHGAAAAQIVVRGRGGAEPLLPNINRRNRQINRRVELQLVTPPGGGW